jgi:hypothetical protein
MSFSDMTTHVIAYIVKYYIFAAVFKRDSTSQDHVRIDLTIISLKNCCKNVVFYYVDNHMASSSIPWGNHMTSSSSSSIRWGNHMTSHVIVYIVKYYIFAAIFKRDSTSQDHVQIDLTIISLKNCCKNVVFYYVGNHMTGHVVVCHRMIDGKRVKYSGVGNYMTSIVYQL